MTGANFCTGAMKLQHTLFTLLAGTTTAHPHHHTDALRQIYQYPLGTWIENLAIRPSDEILVTLLDTARVDQFSPWGLDPKPKTIATFPDALSVSGIAEVEEDVFVVAVGNFSLGGENAGPVEGGWGLWSVDVRTEEVGMEKVVGLWEMEFPNGMTTLPVLKDVLVGDIRTGKIWRVNTTPGEHEVVIENNLTAVVPDPIYGVSGVNGLKVHDGALYFANTGQALFAKLPINTDGTPAGEPSIITRVINSTLQYDDFAIQGENAYLVTGSGNSIEKVGLDGTRKRRIIAGSLNSTPIAQPTACAFGRTEWDRHVLYVVTAGGLVVPVNGDEVVGAQVLAVDMRRWEGLGREEG
ncbi:Putative hetero-Diels-Alderase [Fulvia fulva]|nr:putative hetero-Diels-Alderase [Fulvia fulva]KAK4620474.1 putative hetero-Diels-Alderase [Fulvia fulva]WPV17154.1 Putative hetero-Diels-Alderase [Fulvia fulva]WPV32313.1 Putative hetero-Diels-Alderase [Fulvia fulva]